MSGLKRQLIVALIAVAGAAHVLAAPDLTIRLATLVPADSSWHKALLDMGAAWAKSTNNRVKLSVLAGGTFGDEVLTVKSMRPDIGDLEASLLMVAGLGDIDSSVNVFTMPFFFENDEEALYVREKLTPVIAQRLEAKGFHLMNWCNGGWIQLFSRAPIKTVEEVKKAKLFTTQGNNPMVAWYAKNGFRAVQYSTNDVAQGLATGALDAVPIPPYPVLTLQLFKTAKFMLDVHVAPLVGATVMSNAAWNKISPDDRTKLLEAAHAMETRVEAEAPGLDATSIAAMQRKGLTVTRLDAAGTAAFRTEAAKLVASMSAASGGMVPADIYKLAVDARDAYRKSKGK